MTGAIACHAPFAASARTALPEESHSLPENTVELRNATHSGVRGLHLPAEQLEGFLEELSAPHAHLAHSAATGEAVARFTQNGLGWTLAATDYAGSGRDCGTYCTWVLTNQGFRLVTGTELPVCGSGTTMDLWLSTYGASPTFPHTVSPDSAGTR